MNIIIDLRPLNGGNHSGVEIYLINLIDTMIKEFPDHHFYLFNNSFHPQPTFQKHFQASNSTLIQTNIPNKFFNLALSFTRIFKIDRLIQKNLKKEIHFDLFYMPDLRPFQISKNIVSTATVHDIAFLHFPKFYSLKSRIWYKIIQAKKLLKRIDHLIAVSEFTKKDLIKTLNLPEAKITTIYPGIPPLKKLENYSELKKLYNLPEKYFLTLSPVEPRKNLKRTIEAFKIFSEKHSDYHLVIAGSSNSQIFQTENLSKNSQIHFIGFIPESHKYQLIKNAQLLIYASLFEGFGFPILESQTAQTPLLTSSLSSMPEIAGSSAILVNPLSPQSILNGMEISLKRTNIPNSANLSRFSWNQSAQQTIKLFQSLLN
jgi:glycosyltransferase involved in cell wall biosynthesis